MDPKHERMQDIESLQRFRKALREVSRGIARDKRRDSMAQWARAAAWFLTGAALSLVAMFAAGWLK